MGIKILLWDIDGTILDFKEAEAVAIRKGFLRMNLGECDDTMLKDYSSINAKRWQMMEVGTITKPEVLVGRFSEFFEKYGIDVSLAKEFNEHYQVDLGDTICFRDDAFSLVNELKNKYKQYAVTNGTGVAQHKKLQLSGLKDVLDGYYISDEVGFEKPSKEFFDKAFQDIKEKNGEFNKDETIIIGDSLTSDVAGGNNAGIMTCWYNPSGQKNNYGVHVDYEISNLNDLRNILLDLRDKVM